MPPNADLYLRDVLDVPAPGDVHAGHFTVELSSGFDQTATRVDQYVVTDQLRDAFDRALSLVRSAVRGGTSEAGYLHGSFGAGKSHFMTVLHAVLNRDQAALDKPRLREVVADHDDWLRQRRFLMVPYHLIGAADLDSALLGGYVNAVRTQHPDAPTPAVYRSDQLLEDARRNRQFEGDDLFIHKLGSGVASAAPEDDLPPLEAEGAPASGWTGELLDRAFAAHPGDPLREALVSALLSGPMAAYARGASGDSTAFLPLEDGLSVISRHARDLGYDGIVMFIDELILWLQANMTNQDFVKTEVGKLVKVIESGNADRPVPIVSFVSRQRNLSQLMGEDVTGAEVKNLEAQVDYLTERFEVIPLEDRNLPAIIKERVLQPKPGSRDAIDAAFADVERRVGGETRDALLDAHGTTKAGWDDFRDVYPLTPALLNVLVALAGALQRERTGLKLIQDLLGRRRDDLRIGQVIPLGDLWDVLAGGMGGAFTERLKKEGEQAVRFHRRVSEHLLARYGSADDTRYTSDMRLVQTLLLAYLAPDVAAFRRLTGRRLAALNHGSIKRTRVLDDARHATRRLMELQAQFGELRYEGEEDPVFTLHLSDLDVEPLLDAVADQDRVGARRIWVKETLWQELGVTDTGAVICERDVVWRGTKRTAEFVFGNVCDPRDTREEQFEPGVPGRVRFVVDYPFDPAGRFHADDVRRARELKKDERNHHPTVVWMPLHFSTERAAQLGRLIRIDYLLERDRLDDYAAHLSSDDRMRVRDQLKAQRDNISAQLTAVLRQLYGIARLDEANAETPPDDRDEFVVSLLRGHEPRPEAGVEFEAAMYALVDSVFEKLYPNHPNFDPNTGKGGGGAGRKAIGVRDLRAVYTWIAQAMQDGSRRVTVDRAQLALVKRIAHPLELGEVHDGPLVVGTEWRRRIDQHALQNNVTGDLPVARIREWIAEMGWTGLDTPVTDLVIATYALLADRAWVLNGAVVATPPEIGKVSTGYALRQQEKPGEEEFADALRRAGALFGVAGIPQVVYARNVATLADAVRVAARRVEEAVNGVHAALTEGTPAPVLGLDGDPDAPRVVAARYAVSLVERMLRSTDDTPLVRELAAVAYDVDDKQIGTAIGSARTVLEALDNADWQVLKQLRPLAERDDRVGDRAARVRDELSGVAREFEDPRSSLATKLATAQQQARDLVAEALRLANVPSTPDPVPGRSTDSGGSPTPPAGAGEVRLTNHGDPTVTGPDHTHGSPDRQPDPDSGQPTTKRRITADSSGAALGGQLDALADDIRDYLRANPHSRIEVEWRVVDERSDGQRGEGTTDRDTTRDSDGDA